MKKIVLFIMILVLMNSLTAEIRALADARNVVDNFIQSRGRQLERTSEFCLTTDDVELYIFNLETDGFVVTSADDNFYPVLAYSWTGNYSNENSEDLQFAFIKSDLQKRKEYYLQNPQMAAANQQVWNDMISGIRPLRTFQQWPMDGNTNTDGWCDTQWTQSGVFNQFCPLDTGGNRSVVGCVATAMAQIMHFHEYLGNPVFDNSDDYTSGWWDAIHIDNDHEANDFPDWNTLNGYLDTVVEHYASQELLTSQDLAALSYACGVSVEMSYSSDGSGANTGDVAYALRNKFDYDTATWNENYGGSFFNNVADDMKQMQPCEFSIYTDGWNDGHAIVCDGYNTDDYYHLNYGWGSSNIGWYYLPEGMPSNYSIIGGAVRNIEGGEVPVSVSGELSGPAQLQDCHVLFAGEKYCYEAYSNSDGGFSIPALKPGWYTVSAVSGRIWYVEQELYIDSNLSSLYLEMYNYEALDGQVNADISTGGTYIALYDNELQIATTMADLNGYFSIPDILPGTYTSTASLSPNYYGASSVTINPANQFVLIDMEEYENYSSINWAGEPFEPYSLVPLEISCAIKILSEDLISHAGDVINGVTFKCPIAPTEGSITAQLWDQNQLLAEVPITEFSYGAEIQVEFPVFTEIEPDKDYYVGFHVDSETGVIAWRDAGPRVSGRGAWFRITNWVEMNASFDFNYCIQANMISHIVGNSNAENLIINAGQFNNCYPNPYKQNTSRLPVSIQFQLAKPATASIDLFNIRGQKVAGIFSSELKAGKHSISWQPENLGTGIYFYRLAVNGVAADYNKTIIIK
ncbi:MAG: C10 family peptidase [Candidatus Cloacimonetes bacterium]|nr:C10 family peptidase [Candidatus Cloacimonadota bacterium]